MRLTQILAVKPEIGKAVYEKYPLTKKEKQGCASEKAYMDGKRLELAKRLMDAPTKKEYE